MRKFSQGPTLIEVLIIIVIIGILFAVAIPKFGGRKEKERVTMLRSDLLNVQKAEMAYYDRFKTYGTFPQLLEARLDRANPGDSVTIVPSPTGYEAKSAFSAAGESSHVCTLTYTTSAAVTDKFDCD